MAKQQQDSHSRKHWDGPHWGPNGAVKEGLFKLLSTLIAARKSAPTRFHKLGVVAGITLVYLVIRFGYELEDHTGDELDILASAARGLRQRKFAITCGELVLLLPHISFTTNMLVLAGLMRDYEALFPAKKGHQEVGLYFRQLADHFNEDEYDPPEQRIRILRALAWFTDKYGSKQEFTAYIIEAVVLSKTLGAADQLDAIKREFPQQLH